MNRFNLSFRGEIQADRDPVQAKQSFGKLFGIDDPQRLEKFFSGDTIVLRRNLDRKVAAEYFSKLQKLGIKSELVKVAEEDTSADAGEQSTSAPPGKSKQRSKKKSRPTIRSAGSASSTPPTEKPTSPAVPENLAGQRWAVSSRKQADATGSARRKRAEEEEKRKTEETRLKAEKEEQQRKTAEETRRKAEEEELQRRAAEKARLEAEEEERQRKAAEDARLKAEEEERQRKAAEDARLKAEEEERQRKAAEDARLKAEEEERQRKAAEDARLKAEEEERQRKAAEDARLKAEEEERQRKAAEDARLKAEEEERQRKAAEDARLKAEEEERQRKAAEDARLKAEEEERQRRAAEDARRKAEEEERQRKAAEEARRKAEEEERQRKAAEEARRKAEEEERQRKVAEEARRNAEEEEQQRKVAEEARRRAEEEQEKQRRAAAEARRRAEEEEEKQRQATEEARRRAEEEERQREVAAAARRRAEEEERQRKAAEDARLKAEEEERQRRAAEAARSRAEDEEQQRRAEQAARRKAEAEERQRKAAEESRRRAEDLEQQRKAVEAARRRAEEKEQQRKAEQAARVTAERQAQREIANRKKRLEADKAARLQTGHQHAQAVEEQQETGQAEPGDQIKAMEAQAINRAAEELAAQPSLKPVQAKIKTRLDTPRHRDRKPGILEERRRRRRQPGEPNFFKLRPFRNTPAIQGRAQRSRRKARLGAALTAIGLLALLTMAGAYLSLPPPGIQQGPEAVAIQPGAGPALMAEEQLFLHDRSGTGLGELAISSLGAHELKPPLTFNARGELFAMGALQPAIAGEETVLLRCQLEEPGCALFSDQLAGRAIKAFAVHPLFNSVFVADTAAGELLKLDENGELLASASANMPNNPVLRLESGLLFMNSAEAPGVSVFRPDDDGFGKQLDEILLLPAPAVKAGQSTVRNFLWSADHWWVVLENPDSASIGLYRFDERWNFLSQPPLPAGMTPEQLINWGQKTLVADSRQIPIARFNASGEAEAPLVSDLLEKTVAKQKKAAGLVQLGWTGALLIVLLALVTGLVMALLNWQRWLVYKLGRERGADPVEDLLPSTQWISRVKERSSRLRRTGISYALLATALLLFAISRNITVIQLLALMIALTGPAAALLLVARSQTGSIGISGRQLLLADHSGMYHIGSGPGIKHRGRFLLIDDVAVFTGSALLPAFSPEQVQRFIEPLANTGIRVDRKTVALKLLESHHPLATGGIAIATCWITALVLLILEAW